MSYFSSEAVKPGTTHSAHNRALDVLYALGGGLLAVGFGLAIAGYAGLRSDDTGLAYLGISLGIGAASFGSMLLVAGGIADAVNWQIRASLRPSLPPRTLAEEKATA